MIDTELNYQRDALHTGIERLGVALADEDIDRLLHYLDLLRNWNRAYNLTAITDPQEMVVKHLLDSLAVSPFLTGSRIADIGSGAGLPGIPLAMANPERNFYLIESRAKKVAFMLHATNELGLGNLEVVNSRAEDYRPGTKFDTLVARAFSSLADFIDVSAGLSRPGSKLLAMKGVLPEDEIAALSQSWQRNCHWQRLSVPGLNAERHLITLICP